MDDFVEFEGETYFPFCKVTSYRDSLDHKLAENLKKLVGLEPNERLLLILRENWVTEWKPELRQPFIKMLRATVERGISEQVLKYIDWEVEQVSHKIKENEFYDGKLSPENDLPQWFWNAVYDSEYEGDEIGAYRWTKVQIFEVDRLFREKLLELKTAILTEPHHSIQLLNNNEYTLVQTSAAEVEEDELYITDFSNRKVEAYFMQLADLGFYTKDQVTNFLKSNFKWFTDNGERHKKVKLPKVDRLNQKQVMFFVYQFYNKQSKRRMRKDNASKLLHDNFEYFENTHIDTIYRNMQDEPRKAYPFSTKMLESAYI